MGNGDEAKPLLQGQAVLEHKSWLARWYYKQGKFVATYPKLTAVVCVIFVAWTCVGLIYVDVESNPEKIWVPPSSVTQVQQQYFNYMFTPFYRIEEVYFSTPQDKGNNLITVPYLLAMLDLQVWPAAISTPSHCSTPAHIALHALCVPLPVAASCCASLLPWPLDCAPYTGGDREYYRQQRAQARRPLLQAHQG